MSAASKMVDRFGPWAVITGASEGIGEAFARELASKGLNLVLVARRQRLLEELAAELAHMHGVECRVLATDLSKLENVDALAAATDDIDVGLLVAAAGYGTSGLLIDASLDNETAMVALNCSALLACTWHFARRLSKRGRGGLVLMSSLLAFHGVPRAANYAATKAYVQTLAEGLRVELGPLGVEVVASAPGPVGTGFAKRANLHMSQTLTPEVVARVTMAGLGNKTTVRPGWLSKLLGWSLAMLPRWAQVLVITEVMKGMTAHQASGRAVDHLRR